jgi:hypothetical protein
MVISRNHIQSADIWYGFYQFLDYTTGEFVLKGGHRGHYHY